MVSIESSEGMSDSASSPRVVRRIVVGYAVDYFPGSLIIAHHTLQAKLARAGYAVAVTLAPLHDLPQEGVDILLAPPTLAEAARRAAPDAYHVSLETFAHHPFYDQLLEELAAGQVWTAERLSERPAGQGEIMVYRGYERVD